MYGVRTASGWLAEEATALSRCLHDSGDGINNGFSFCACFSFFSFSFSFSLLLLFLRTSDDGDDE